MDDRIRDEDARALHRGSREAFERVYRSLSGPLQAFLQRAATRDAAPDLLQETWLRVIRAGRVPPRGVEIRPWVFRIAYHLAADHWRGARRRGGRLPEEVAAVPGVDPAREAESREIRQQIDAAVGDLPTTQRAVFLLREDGGLPFREVAQILGIPLGTALARMRYALSKLRRALSRALQETER